MSEWDAFPAANQGSEWDAFPPSGQSAPVTVGGLYKAVNAGAENAVAGLAGVPNAVATLGAKGIQAATNVANRALGLPEDTRDLSKPGLVSLPTAEQALATIKRDYNPQGWIGPTIGPESYQPQNRAESLAKLGTEFSLNAALPGGLITKAANVALPTVATQAVQEMGGGPIAQAVAALAGGYGAAKVGRAVENYGAAKLPKMADVGGAATTAYKDVENATVGVPFANRDQFVSDLKNTLSASAKREANVPEVYAAINQLPAKADVADLVILQKNLTPLVGREGVAARMAIAKVENELDRLVPGIGTKLKTADQNYNAFKTAEGLDKRIQKTESQTSGTHSGTNLGNKLRQSATAAAFGPQSRFMRPEEIAALEKVAQGTFLQNQMRKYGNLLGNGVGLGGLVSGEILGGHEGGVTGLAGPILAGTLLRGGYNRAVSRQAARVGQQVLARSPEAMRLGATYRPPQGLLPPLNRGLLPFLTQLSLPVNQ